MAVKDEYTETEQRFRKLFDARVAERADAVRAELEATRNIAALCVDARREGVAMARLAEWVRVLDVKTDELRPVTRQAVDNLVAAYEGRTRQPRRRRGAPETNGRTPSGAINSAVFGV